VDAFTLVLGGLMVLFLVGVILLGLFSQRSPRDYLDWQPTRSPEVEMENEIDDVAQMIEAQNAMKRRRGVPEISEAEMEARTRADAEELRKWRES
jgi:hypothetical protein